MPQVLQVAARGFEGRDLLHAFGSAEGQQRGHAVHAGVRKPRLGRGDQPPGILDPALLCQLAGDERAGLIPGQGDGSGREIGRAGQVEERRQQVFVAHFTGIHQLRNTHQLHVGRCESVGIRPDLGVGQGGVGGAQIDADHVSGLQGRVSRT